MIRYVFLLGNFRALRSDEQHILVAFGSDLDENITSQFETYLLLLNAASNTRNVGLKE